MLAVDDPRFEPYLQAFAAQSGITAEQVRTLHPDDQYALLSSWSAANRLARLELRLLAEQDPAPVRPVVGSDIVALVVLMLSLYGVLFVAVWGFSA